MGSWDSTVRRRSPTLKLMWRGQLLLLLSWTALTIFPYSRTSFLTDCKTGWIVFLKGPLIGTMSTTGQNFPYLLLPGTANRYFVTCNVYYCNFSSNPLEIHEINPRSGAPFHSHKSLITHCDLKFTKRRRLVHWQLQEKGLTFCLPPPTISLNYISA